MNFYPIYTEDNTISLFNVEVGDVYHSKVGAYTEALHKYIMPSGIQEFISENNRVNILDICYGLGYNSRTAVNEILKINPDAEVNLAILEIDPVVLAFSVIIGNECFSDETNNFFFEKISSQIDIQQIVENYLQNIAVFRPVIKNKIQSEYKLVQPEVIRSKLHNIYYRTISTRNSIDKNKSPLNLNAEIYMDDARNTIQKLNSFFDFIFLDPFTPSKTPALWTEDFFKLLYKLMDDEGNITTYSNAAPIRAGMINAGFKVGCTSPVGKKSTGTIAYKNPAHVRNKLPHREKGVLDTKAGIPYRDENLAATSEEILFAREKKMNISDRISSSSFLKKLQKN